MISETITLNSLSNELMADQRLSKLEKCVVLLQMYTYVGEDLYDTAQPNMLKNCDRKESENFIKDNASFIEF